MKKKHPVRNTIISILFSFIFLEILCGLLVPYNGIAIKRLYRYKYERTFEHQGLITYMTYTDPYDILNGTKRYIVPNISFFVFSWFVVVPEHLEDINKDRYYAGMTDMDKYEIDLANNGWLYPTEFVNPFPFPQDGYNVHVIADAGSFPEAHDGDTIIDAASRLPAIPVSSGS